MNLISCYNVCFFLLNVPVVFGDLISPQNVTLVTFNTQYILRWDWDYEAVVNGTVTFTAQYQALYRTQRRAYKQEWMSVCVNVTEHCCDFTYADLFYFGMFLLRVRANIAQQSSPWVQIEFCPDKHAALGPPSSVELNSVEDGLKIIISDPVSSNNLSMKELAQNMYYLIQYWKKSDGSQMGVISRTDNVVTLSELDRWTWYCVRIQSRCGFYNKSSIFSDTLCSQTGGRTTYMDIFLYFLSLGLCSLLLLVLSVGFYRTFKNTFYPTVQLPVYIEHWAVDPEVPWLLSPESESVCKNLDITSAERKSVVTAMGVHVSDQNPETQSQLGSGDSGFNSTEEDSCQRQYSITQHITQRDGQTEDTCKKKHREEMPVGIQELCLK